MRTHYYFVQPLMLTVNSVCTSRNQQTFATTMTDSMKFGPEWLRNLSSEGNTSTLTGGGTRYHLAEHRYGREEMLALFEQSLKLRPPHTMSNFKTLYVEQALNPLALAPMTEDENRLWSTRTVPPGAPRGRGGSMDRGRGRGRGGGGTFHPGFSRSNSAYDEPTRPFERSQSDRGWSERNGGDLGDWGPSTSPRKDYTNSRGDNWRRHRPSDDTEPTADGWRSATTPTAAPNTAPSSSNAPSAHNNHRPSSGVADIKWGPARNISGNWRDGDARDDQLSDRQATNRISWHSSTSVDSNRNQTQTQQTQRKIFDALDDHLPEWATENPSEAGGTFDASGAFHGSDADDDFPGGGKYHKNNLQKSASQQNIINKKPNALSTSQSATNLTKKPDESSHKHQQHKEQKTDDKPIKEIKEIKEIEQNDKQEDPIENKQINNKKIDAADEFDHMKEVTDDIVAKLILDDEIQQMEQKTNNNVPTPQVQYPTNLGNVLGPQNVPPPPGSGVLNDKWYYRDPQGEVQGPFTAQEMSDWFRAGYFTVSLLVRRHIDERYFTLGDLVKQCPGSIPFLTCRLPPLKAELAPFGKLPGPPELNDPVQQIHMQRLLQRHAETIRTLSQTEPWSAMSNLQQRELVTQHMMQQPQVLSDLPFIPPVTHNQMSNPLMHMISQMQQANKLPMVEKTAANQHLDPLQQLVQQMGGMQANIPPPPPPQQQQQQQQQNDKNKEDPIQSLLRQLANQPQRDYWNIRANQPPPQQPQQQQQQQQQQPQPQPTGQWMNVAAAAAAAAAAAGIPTHSMWDLPPQVQPQPQIPVSQQIPMPPSSLATNNLHSSLLPPIEVIETVAAAAEELKKKAAELEKEQKQKERKEQAEREKRKKEQEHLEKLKQQKELEEKRKEEQKKMEALKKAEMEKAKKEEEKIRKELEKVKREAEEKRLRELEEKRKQKEQRKAEEELRKKQEEERRQQQEEETKRKEQEKQREEQTRRQAEALRKMQEQQQQQRTKVAPWCQSNTQSGGANASTNATSLSLAEIQRAEREKRATEAALQLQQQKALAASVAAAAALKETQDQQQQQQQTSPSDKNTASSTSTTTMQLKWATKKPIAPKKVKSLAEIQAEEQERVAKQLAEQRLAQQQKEKELAPIAHAASTSIWSSASQSLTWNTQTTQQTGFWDEATTTPPLTTTTTPPPVNKPVKQNNKAAATTTTTTTPQQTTLNNNQINNNNKTAPVAPKTAKNRAKKEEENIRKLFDKNAANNDEFTAWCMKTLATLNSDVDIPTFVGFLFDIESPYEIKDYVRQYLGDSAQALHFANQFIERRSKMKNLERNANQHKDDLCMPAPAINPSVEFQEVKGKGKKTKKSKMTKVDNRILGFSVTAAENRINVGDRDYGDNV